VAGIEFQIFSGAVLALCAAITASGPSRAQDAPVTASDADALRQQIIPCWNIPLGIEHPEKFRVVLEVTLAPDGRVTGATVKDDPSRMSDPAYRAVADAALRAVKNPSCVPLRLPEGRYRPKLNIVFDLEKAINGGY